jgi:hypothetical protein
MLPSREAALHFSPELACRIPIIRSDRSASGCFYFRPTHKDHLPNKNTVGANPFAIGQHIQPILVESTGLSRMNSLPQVETLISSQAEPDHFLRRMTLPIE